MFGRTKNLPDDQIGLVKQLLASPEARPFIEAQEARALVGRRELVAKLAALDSPAALKDAQALQAKRAAAVKRVADAEKALQEAKDAIRQADADIAAASTHWHRARLEQELRDAADPRIAQFIAEVQHIWMESGHHAHSFPVVTTSFIGVRDVRYTSNVEEVTETRALLRDAVEAAKAMQVEALSRAEVTARLHTWCERMRGPLQGLNISWLDVTDAGVAVGRSHQPAAA